MTASTVHGTSSFAASAKAWFNAEAAAAASVPVAGAVVWNDFAAMILPPGPRIFASNSSSPWIELLPGLRVYVLNDTELLPQAGSVPQVRYNTNPESSRPRELRDDYLSRSNRENHKGNPGEEEKKRGNDQV